jgi:hypothetical protein
MKNSESHTPRRKLYKVSSMLINSHLNFTKEAKESSFPTLAKGSFHIPQLSLLHIPISSTKQSAYCLIWK